MANSLDADQVLGCADAHTDSTPLEPAMFKDIVLPIFHGEICEAAVHAACAIASSHQGHLSALVGVSMITPNAAAWAYYPEGMYASLKESADTAIDAIANKLKARLARESVSHEIRRCSSVWLTSAEMAVVGARYADLIVMGRSNAPSDGERRLFTSLLVGSGRPLLLVPEMAPEADRFEHVVVAWKSSREAARALHDALPLLRKARSVDVLVVDDASARGPETDAQEAQLSQHLTRHGIVARQVRRERGDTPVDLAIIDHTAESRAHLIVAGGYSHARALEQVFGGVTRTLFEHAARPVLFSH